MNFELDEGQRLIRDSVARYLESEYAFVRRREHLAEPYGFAESLWRDFADLGWLGAALPEDHGGLGGGSVETALLMEQIGRHLVVSPFLPSAVFGAAAVLAGGSEAQRSALLPALAIGEMRLAPAFNEPRGRFNPYFVETRAAAVDGGFALDGHKCVVPFAATADRLVVSARTSGERDDRAGITLFVVDTAAGGIEYEHFRTQDGGHASEVRFASVRVAAHDVLGEPGAGADALDAALDTAAAAACAEACGAMWAVYERTLEYMKTREQFGAALGSFQALAHRIVDVWMNCQLAQSMACDAAIAVRDAEGGARSRTVAAAMNKIARAGRLVGQEGIQLHGGIGMTDDLPIGHYLKRLVAIGQRFGDAAHHLERFRALSR